MGQEHHPAWRLNLEADPHAHAHVLLGDEAYAVVAHLLDPEEKAKVWPAVKHTIPQCRMPAPVGVRGWGSGLLR